MQNSNMHLSLYSPRLAGCASLIFFLANPAAVHAAPEADPSAQLREQLRSVLLQLRTSQTEAANAKVAQTAAEAKIEEIGKTVKSLEARNAELQHDADADKASSKKSIAALEVTAAAREKRLVEFQEALEKWKDGYRKAAAAVIEKESARSALADEAILNKRTIADLKRKNIALFNISNEILDRYKNYSLGKALGAREPFIGTTRVKVENLVQGYTDKIVENRIHADKP